MECVAEIFRIEGEETRVKESIEVGKREERKETEEYKEMENMRYNETDSLVSRTEPTRLAYGVDYSRRSTDVRW